MGLSPIPTKEMAMPMPVWPPGALLGFFTHYTVTEENINLNDVKLLNDLLTGVFRVMEQHRAFLQGKLRASHSCCQKAPIARSFLMVWIRSISHVGVIYAFHPQRKCSSRNQVIRGKICPITFVPRLRLICWRKRDRSLSSGEKRVLNPNYVSFFLG